LKTNLTTMLYDFCTGESFAAEKNLCASRYGNIGNLWMVDHNWSTLVCYYNRYLLQAPIVFLCTLKTFDFTLQCL